MNNFEIIDCNFHLIKIEKYTILNINGSNNEFVSIKFCSFSRSECYQLVSVNNVKISITESTIFVENAVTEAPWSIDNAKSLELISENQNVQPFSSGCRGSNERYMINCNFSSIVAESFRSAICYIESKNKVAEYVHIDSCVGPPLVSFHSSTEPASISHFIFSNCSVSMVFVFEVSSLTATVEDSIFRDITGLKSIFEEISYSQDCDVLLVGCRSDVSGIPNANGSLSFNIKMGMKRGHSCEERKKFNFGSVLMSSFVNELIFYSFFRLTLSHSI